MIEDTGEGRTAHEESPQQDGSGNDAEDEKGRGRGGDRIGVSGMDESIVRLQLAARWAEQFAPENGDSLAAMLRRFRAAYDYLDAVMHGMEPQELQSEPAAAPIEATTA